MTLRKNIILIISMICILLCSCGNENEFYSSEVNINEISSELTTNLSKIRVTNETMFSIPEADSLCCLKSEKELKSTDEYLSEFKEFINWFEGCDNNIDNISYNYLTNNEIISFDTVQSDISEALYSISVSPEYNKFGNDLYVNLVSGAFVAQDSILLSGEYKPEKIDSFCFIDTNAENNEYYNIAREIADNTLKKIKSEIPFVLPDDIDFVPYSCVVSNIDDSNNEFNITYIPTYKNVNFDNCVSYVYYNENGETVSADENASTLNVSINSNGKIYRILAPYSMKLTEENITEKCLDINSAYNIVDESISDDMQIIIDTVELIYCYRDVYNNTRDEIKYTECRPTWKLVSNNTGIGEYPSLAFLVDALTGEIRTYIPSNPW